jgi:rRNA processing protein Gar1
MTDQMALNVADEFAQLSEGEISDFKFESEQSEVSCEESKQSEAESSQDVCQKDKQVKVELVDKEEPIEPFQVENVPIDAKYLLLGTVISDMQNLIIIKTFSGEERVLQVGSVIFNSKNIPLGRISDIWGPVRDPLYTVTKFKSDYSDTVGVSDTTTSVNDTVVESNDTMTADNDTVGDDNIVDVDKSISMVLETVNPLSTSDSAPVTVPIDQPGSTSDSVAPISMVVETVGNPLSTSDSEPVTVPIDKPVSTSDSAAPVQKTLQIDKPVSMVGESAYYVADLAEIVFTAPLKALKGTDASDLYDNEAEHPEFSDDEQERAFKMSLKKSTQELGQENVGDSIPTGNKIFKRKSNDTNLNQQRQQRNPAPKSYDQRQGRNSFQKTNQQRNPAQSHQPRPPVQQFGNGHIRPPVFKPGNFNVNNANHVIQQSPYSQPTGLVGRGYKSSLQVEAQAKLRAQIQASQYQSQMQQAMAIAGNQSSKPKSFPLPTKIQLQSPQVGNQSQFQPQSQSHFPHYNQQMLQSQHHFSPHGYDQTQQSYGNQSQIPTTFPFHFQQQQAYQQFQQQQYQPVFQQQFQEPNHQLFQQPNHQTTQSQYSTDLPSAYSGQMSSYSSQMPSYSNSQPSYSSNLKISGPDKSQIPTPQPSPVPPVSENQKQQLAELAKFLNQ